MKNMAQKYPKFYTLQLSFDFPPCVKYRVIDKISDKDGIVTYKIQIDDKTYYSHYEDWAKLAMWRQTNKIR